MRFAASGQKFEEVSESHGFLSKFVFLSRVIAIDACFHTYALDSIPGHPPELSDYVKLLLTNGSSHVFEIDLVLKSIL